MDTREFHIGDILSITGEALVSPRGMSGVNDILSFMAGGPVFTISQIPVARAMRPALLRQHPQLAEVDDSSVTTENWREWLAEQVAAYGETLEVRRPEDGAAGGIKREIAAFLNQEPRR